MSHHLFIVSPVDTLLFSLAHQSTKPQQVSPHPLAANLPSWSTSTFANTFSALAGAPSHTSTPTAAGTGNIAVKNVDRQAVMMIANASLDAIEDVIKRDNAMYLKAVDKFNEWTVSAFITPGNVRFILLHQGKNDDGIRLFFMDVWELYVKTCLNPFFSAYTPIKSIVFDGRVRSSAKRYL